MTTDRDITTKMPAKRQTTSRRAVASSPLSQLISLALAEDIGSGDITTRAIVDPKQQASALIESQSAMILYGLEVARKVAYSVDSRLAWKTYKQDGEACTVNDPLSELKGSAASILVAERTMLNFLMHLSGVATLTRRFADAIAHTKTRITDTRKTTPGMRIPEKAAVLAGGGTNHRMGLYDRYLVKNNHVDMAGSVPDALEAVRIHHKPGTLIEVEARDLDEVEEALEFGAQIILLDNFPVDDVRRAVKLVGGRIPVEVSGGITLDNIVSYAEAGPDFIAVGGITHSAPAMPIHMIITPE